MLQNDPFPLLPGTLAFKHTLPFEFGNGGLDGADIDLGHLGYLLGRYRRVERHQSDDHVLVLRELLVPVPLSEGLRAAEVRERDSYEDISSRDLERPATVFLRYHRHPVTRMLAQPRGDEGPHQGFVDRSAHAGEEIVL